MSLVLLLSLAIKVPGGVYLLDSRLHLLSELYSYAHLSCDFKGALYFCSGFFIFSASRSLSFLLNSNISGNFLNAPI